MKRFRLAAIVFAVAVLVVLIYSTMHLSQYRVEVCMEFQGRKECRTVSASTKTGALRVGAENACALIASGVTETLACEQATPLSVRWLAER